ncbi:MAG: penicillin-binding protein 2 [Alphaproteobacteria bacterium GM7ARS4]|nr:penicillin-binding protein 2 [Alphaproteobacteria bacterium GM7ARS4]
MKRRLCSWACRDALSHAHMRGRLTMCLVCFACVGMILVWRLFDVMVFVAAQAPVSATHDIVRGNIYDRNGVLLAVSLPTTSAYVHPDDIYGDRAKETFARAVASVLPHVDGDHLYDRLKGREKFIWLERNMTPTRHQQLMEKAIPGVHFVRSSRRFYPHKALTSHIVGFTDIDHKGLAGVEYASQEALHQGQDVHMTVDIRFQHILKQALLSLIPVYKPKAAVAIMLDVRDSSILASVSLPDYNPHYAGKYDENARFHRATHGIYELGSPLKLFTAALALERGASLYDRHYNVRDFLRVDDIEIRDAHIRLPVMSLAQIVTYSSNVGAARVALSMGQDAYLRFLKRFHFFQSLPSDISERGTPRYPSVWHKGDWVSSSYGYSLAITPLHLATAVASLVNGGVYHAPFIVRGRSESSSHVVAGYRVISEGTSASMRRLLRDVVIYGTGKQASDTSVTIGGKTGTAEKASIGGYDHDRLVVSFVAVFPMEEPRYALFVLVDEPQTSPAGEALSGGTVATPLARDIAQHIMRLHQNDRHGGAL